jgi:maleylpyruvate isomerase
MLELPALLNQVHAAGARVLKTVLELDAEALAEPSALPGWSRAHVVVHLARNADAQRRLIAGALRGETQVEQYPGGAEGRDREIALGVTEPAALILEGLQAAVAALEQAWAALPDEAWQLCTATLRGSRSLAEGAAVRWRELELHHADLALAYTPAQWPEEFVAHFLGRTVAGLPARALPTASGFRCRLADADAGVRWLVTEQSVEASVEPGDDASAGNAADAEVSGHGWQLLAWLSGRGDHGLRYAGPPAARVAAARLPELFPHR